MAYPLEKDRPAFNLRAWLRSLAGRHEFVVGYVQWIASGIERFLCWAARGYR